MKLIDRMAGLVLSVHWFLHRVQDQFDLSNCGAILAPLQTVSALAKPKPKILTP
jgi:hypothetical protein